jgi:sulfite exporter TauE/SafE
MVPSLAELSLIFVSGVLGSAHCIGMCGGISATMNLGAKTLPSAVIRQIFWSSGRTLTYLFLGVAAAAVGAKLLRSQGNAVRLQAGFAVLAGILLVIQGLQAAGWLKWRVRRRSQSPCITASVFSQFFQGGSWVSAFVAGIATGFLPCGLVYSFLALAASSGHPGRGAAIMLSFGLGTFPVMLMTGAGLSLATLGLRRKLLKVAGICVLITGVLTTARGIAFAAGTGEKSASQSCPLCHTDAQEASTTDPAPGSSRTLTTADSGRLP